tara:strand:+ start:4300 stop:4551 length:252 start_codon:yes stop_codon:yes gene_type:complete
MVPEEWTWKAIWEGIWHGSPINAYVGCRFVHAISMYSVDDVVLSITNFEVLKAAFLVLRDRGDAQEVAKRCKIDNLIIWRLIY